MNCESFDRRVQDVMDRRRSVTTARDLVAHAKSCSRCQRHLDAYRLLQTNGPNARTNCFRPGPIAVYLRPALAAALAGCLLVIGALLFREGNLPTAPAVAEVVRAADGSAIATPSTTSTAQRSAEVTDLQDADSFLGWPSIHTMFSTTESFLDPTHHWDRLSQLPQQISWQHYPRYAGELVWSPWSAPLSISVDLLRRVSHRGPTPVNYESFYLPTVATEHLV